MSRTARGGFYFIIIQVVGLGAGVLTQRVLGTVLTPEGYGAFGLIVSFTIIVSTILTAGIPRAASRFVSVSTDNTKWIYRKIVSIQGKLTLGVFLVYLLLSPIVAGFLLPSGEEGVILLAALIIPVESFNILYYNFLNGLKEYHKQGNARLVYFSVKALCSILLVIAGYRLFGAVAGFVLGSAFSLFIEYFYLKKVTRKIIHDSPEPVPDFLRNVLSFSVPLIVFSTLSLVLTSIDVFIIKATLGYYASGIYYAAKNISLLPNQVLIAAAAAIFPAMSAIHERKNKGEFKHYSVLTMRYIFLIIIPSALFMVVFSNQLIHLIYGIEYSTGIFTLQLLSIAFLTSVATSFVTTLLISTGHTRDIVLVNLIAICVHLVGSTIMIPIFGIAGAGYSWIIVSVLLFLLMSGILIRREGNVIPWMHFLKCVISLIPALALFLFLQSINLYISFALAILIYGCFCLLLRVLTKEDLKFLTKSIIKTS